MSFPVNITLANPPEGYCPTTITQLYDGLRTDLTAEVSTSYLPYILGSSTPAVEDQDKAWIRQDAAGRPLGTFLFYAGSWRRQYNGKFNEITLFNGNPALFFDGTGRGLTTSEWDGWSICNGQNGTPNLTDKFIVAAHMDDSAGQTGYSSGWRTMVSGSILATGGSKDTTLGISQIPRDPSDVLVVDTFTADGNARDPAGLLFGHHSVSTGDPGDSGTEILIDADAGEGSPDVVPTLPPYFALAYVIFTGYT